MSNETNSLKLLASHRDNKQQWLKRIAEFPRINLMYPINLIDK